MKIAIIGLGSRGMNYGSHLAKRSDTKITAVCDLLKNKAEIAKNRWGIPSDMCFTDENAFFGRGKLADVLIIATQDKDHFGHVMKALELGYDILVEKPLSPSIDECLAMEKRARELNRKVLVCHVLRYAPYYRKIKEIIESGALGEIKEIRHSENISYWHFAHSYVRGNWRREEDTSPLLLAKCCHDMDVIFWLSGSKCESLSSYGDLSFFKAENAPIGAADNCFDCPHRDVCNYDAEYQYVGRKKIIGRGRKKFPWGTYAFCQSKNKKDVLDALKNGGVNGRGKEFSRCVFKCDNNVVDCQTVSMKMQNGIKCVMVVSAFNEENHRHIEIRGTLGELYADDKSSVMTVRLFGKKPKKIKVNFLSMLRGHYGGDEGIAKAVAKLDTIEAGEAGYTWIGDTIESHRIVAAAELSRKSDGIKVDMSEIADKD